MGNNGLQEKIRKFKRIIAVILCVIMATGTGVSSLAELGPLNIWIPIASDSNATKAGDDEEEQEESRVVIASWSDATLSDATASNATNWQAELQTRIDALPGIQEIREDETNELLVDTYWEVLDIMDVLNDQVGVALYDSIMDADDGSIEGADELDVSRLYEIADYVMAAYAALEASEQMEDPIPGTYNGQIKVEVKDYDGDDQAVLTLEIMGDPDEDSAADNHTNDYYSFWTAETLTLDYTIYGGIPENYTYRIYFMPADVEGLYSSLEEGQSIGEYLKDQLTFYTGNANASLTWDDKLDAWYLEVAEKSYDGTYGGTVQVTYPSPDTPGGDLYIFGVIYDVNTGNIVSNNWNAFDAYWQTEPETFDVLIELDETLDEGLVLESGEGSSSPHVAVKDNPDQEIVYIISMADTTPASDREDSTGEDLIRYIDVTDVITLPAGISLDADVILEATVTEEDGAQFIRFNSGGTVLTLVNRSENNSSGYSIPYYNATDNTITLTWRIENATLDETTGLADSQIENGVWEVWLNGDYLIADEDVFSSQASHEIKNEVTYHYTYTWSENQENKSEATIEIANPSSNVVLSKTKDRSGTVYMGEDAYYTISLYNQGTVGATDLLTLEDTGLDTTQYITPANIIKMFFGDSDDEDKYLAEDSGSYLTLTITDATVYYDDATDLDMTYDMSGEKTVYKTNANNYLNAKPEHTGVTITMTRMDKYTIEVLFTDGSDTFYGGYVSDEKELTELFREIGYVVTADARYSAVWNLSAAGTLTGGDTWHYRVYSSMKDTFQYYEDPYLNQADGYNTAANTVTLYYDNSGKSEEDYQQEKTKSATYTNIMRDYLVNKKVNQIDGEAAGDTDVFYRGSIITYQLEVEHFGTGTVEDLPLVDNSKGSQSLLVPLELNKESIQAGNWPVSWDTIQKDTAHLVTINGVTYYDLWYTDTRASSTNFTGTYNLVWFDETHCAASVELTTTNQYAPTTYTYVITWNYHTLEGNGDIFTYYMLVEADADKVVNAQNTVYLNNRYRQYHGSYRISALYDEIAETEIKAGSLDKKILTSDTDVGDSENETYAESSVLDLANADTTTVRYKLWLQTKSGNSEMTFQQVRDILPYTYGVFTWEKGKNVKVYGSVYETAVKDDSGKELSPGLEDNYEIYYSDAEGKEVSVDADGYYEENGSRIPAYQAISWGDGNITLPEDAEGIWIYVELDFSLKEEDQTDYAEAVSGYLRNTFSAVIPGNTTVDTADVIHTVKKDAKAYLQKGVYWIKTYGSTSSNNASDLRNIYYNSVSSDGNVDKARVAYYIQLYNASSSYLYLEEIQDLAPEGFTFVSLYGAATGTPGSGAYEGGGNTANTEVTTDPDSPVSSLSGDDISEKPIWKTAHIQAEEGTDGVLRFLIDNEGGDLHEDETTGYCYLEEGEAICFIAEFEVGVDSETEKYAENKIAMPYVDFSDGEVTVAKVSGTAVNAYESTTVAQNVGGCSILDETERRVEGFQSVTPKNDGMEISQWLTSDVTVRRGAIIPGINKAVITDVDEDGGDTVEWQITVSNDGEIPMENYTIRDIMDSPYLLMGAVNYKIYEGDDLTATPIMEIENGGNPMFTIIRDSTTSEEALADDSEYTLTWHWLNVLLRDDGEGSAKSGEAIEVSGLPVSSYISGTKATEAVTINVTVGNELDGSDINNYLSIDFTDVVFAIPAGGRGVLTVTTKVPAGTGVSTGTYYNLAKIIPTQVYEDDAVSIGDAVSATADTSAYVKSSDQIHVTNGYSTSAQKWIQSNDNKDRVARSETGIHYIELDSESETFTYTLEVTNNLSSSMRNLIIVDSLPQSGDYSPFTTQNEKTERGSQFQVDFYDGAVKVMKGVKTEEEIKDDTPAEATIDTTAKEDGNITDKVTVLYSEYSEFGKGMSDGNKWASDSTADDGGDFWTTDYEGARSIRIEFNEPIEKGKSVQVSFTGKICTTNEADIAEPGEIGWNSFAYKYTTDKSESDTSDNGSNEATLWAAPRKVGIKFPDMPKLTKEIMGVDEDAAANMKDQTFRFLVHEGKYLSGFDYTGKNTTSLEKDLIDALEENNLKYFTKELTIDVSESLTGTITLDPGDAFTYVNEKPYTVVELPYNNSSRPGNDAFIYGYMAVGSSYVQKNVITFTYTSGTMVRVYADNKVIEWALDVAKVDKDTEEPIPGVVFGLYAATKPDTSTSESLMESLEGILATPSDAAKIKVADDDGDESTWYLIDMQTTDEDGKILWSGMTDSIYYLKELKAADGYSLLTEPILVDYWEQQVNGTSESEDGTYKIIHMTVENKVGYLLPKTGGHGTLWIQLLGLLLMSMGVSLTYITKRKITSSRRTK